MNAEITMYSTRFCPYCMRARMLLDSKNVSYQDIAVDAEPQLRRQMMELSGRSSVPQIWIGEAHVGGYDELAALERQGGYSLSVFVKNVLDEDFSSLIFAHSDALMPHGYVQMEFFPQARESIDRMVAFLDAKVKS